MRDEHGNIESYEIDVFTWDVDEDMLSFVGMHDDEQATF